MSDLHWTDLVRQARELAGDADEWTALYVDPKDPESSRADAVLTACEAFHGHGFSDDELGDVDGFGRFYRVNRWTVETDSRGFSELTEHGSEAEAVQWWSTLEDEYTEWCGPDEEDAIMEDRPSGGYSVSFAGRSIGEGMTRDEAESAIRSAMESDGYWPDVWHISDHGNAQRITLKSTS